MRRRLRALSRFLREPTAVPDPPPGVGDDGRGDAFRALLEVNKKINPAVPTDALLTSIAEEAARLLDVDNAGFRLVDGDDLVVAGLAGTARETMIRPRIKRDESLSGRVATEGRAIICAIEGSGDVMVPEHFAASRRLGYTSYLGVPLQVGDRTIGAFSFRARRPFTPRDQEVAEAFAGQAALALEQSRLYRDARRQAERMTALAAVERLVAETLDAAVVAQRIVDSVCDLLGARSSVLYRLDAETDRLVAVTVARETWLTFEWTRALLPDEGIAGLAVRERRAVLAEDSLADPRIVYGPDTFASLQASTDRALLAAPLIVRERVFGVLAVGDRTGRRFTEEDVRLAEAFADQAAMALENARLFELEASRRAQSEALAEVERVMAAELNRDRLLELIVERATRLFAADCVIHLARDERLVTVAASAGIDADSDTSFGRGLVGTAAQEREGFLVNDYARSPHALEKYVARGARRAMGTPLILRDRLLGVISVFRWGTAAPPFTTDDRGVLESFATQAAIALENARLFEENRRQVEELSVLHELSQAVTGQLDHRALIEAVAAQVSRVLDARQMIVVLVDEERDDLEVVFRVADGAPEAGHERYPRRSVGLQSVVLETGGPLRTDDYGEACARHGVQPVDRSAHLRFWLGVPMTAGGRTLGLIALRSAEHAFTASDERLLANIGHLAALALRSAQLFDERTRAYGELAAAQDHLVRTEKLRALGEMASGVAHDFNNVLAAIVGRAQLLQRHVPDAKLAGWLQVIERSALDGAQTVRRLQEFARVRRDQPFEPVDLNDVVRDALEMTQSRWREDALRQGIVIDARMSRAPGASVAGDAAELREAMTNLILNAVDAMPRGGALRIGIAVVGDRVELSVSDTGVGIPAALKERIFDPFFTTKGPQGTGLGLSMTYGILSRHGARITVESDEGRGSTFRIAFPRGEPLVTSAPSAPDQPAPLEGLRCLVVDDEAAVAAVLGDVLESSGHRVVVLTDGAEAIARVRREPFDVVFTDLAMPRVSGWDVAHAVKAAAPGVPVFLVTGFGVELSVAERRAHGIEAVFSKPLRIEDIAHAVAGLNRRANSRHAPEGPR